MHRFVCARRLLGTLGRSEMDRSEDGSNAVPNERQKVVLFADLLGFGALTEQCPLDIAFLRSSDRLAWISTDSI